MPFAKMPKTNRRTDILPNLVAVFRIILYYMILSILVETFISKISLPMQPVPEIGSISGA